MLTIQHQTPVRQVVDQIWNKGWLDIADELFTPDYVNHGGLITDLIRGPEAVKISVVMFRRAFPRLSITVDELRTDGDLTLLRWTAHGLHRVALENNDASQATDSLAGVTHCRLSGGKIQESWTFWDQSSGFCVLDRGCSAALPA